MPFRWLKPRLWRLDAWDPLAGRAFICLRQPDRDADPALDHAAVFVAPPFFHSEPLASRAPGLAATRGTFQAALFVNGEEAGFETLEDAIAFVKRGYSSGSDPLPGAPGVGITGPIEGGGLELALPELPRAEGYLQLDTAIAEAAQSFAAIEAERHKSVAFAWKTETRIGPHNLRFVMDMAEIAGQALIIEMMARFPLHGDIESFMSWSHAARRLSQQLIRLGMWRNVRSTVGRALQAKATARTRDALARRLRDTLGWEDIRGDTEHLIEALFLRHHPYWYPWEYPYWEHDRYDEAEIYQDFARFPLPRVVADRYGGDEDKYADPPTLLTLLSAWFGHPAGLEQANRHERALLMFAGACVVVGPLQRKTSAYRSGWMDANAEMANAFAERLGTEAWNWIASQLPDRKFANELEDVLTQIPHAWSRTAHAGAASGITPETIEPLDDAGVAAVHEALGEIITDLVQDAEPA